MPQSWPGLRTLGLSAVLVLAHSGEASGQRSAYEELQSFSGVLSHILNNYADTVSYRQMVRAAIDGVLESLDPHSYFLSHRDDSVLRQLARGELAGVGVHIEPIGGSVVVRTLDRDGPARAAGLLPGDRLVAVNDTSVAGLDAPQVQARLAGRENTKVKLLLERGPRLEPHEFTVLLARRLPRPSTVDPPLPLDAGTVYVRLHQFAADAAEDLEAVLKRASDDGRKRVILDLRGNPGGRVGEAVELAALFLPRGVPVFSTRGRVAEVNEDHVTRRDGSVRSARLIILIDEGSASAAEVLAGALQDLDRAVLVGRRTFGKALIQAPFFLPDGDVVWLTIGRVHTPSGRVIQREYRGLTVDQYRRFAGTSGSASDTLPLYHTQGGRPVRGGGGIAPDVETSAPPPVPAWWSVAHASGWIQEIVDGAAAKLAAHAASVDSWEEAATEHLALADLLLERARSELRVRADVGPELRQWMGRTLAARVAATRWGLDAETRVQIALDPDVEVAMASFARWQSILAGSRAVDGEE